MLSFILSGRVSTALLPLFSWPAPDRAPARLVEDLILIALRQEGKRLAGHLRSASGSGGLAAGKFEPQTCARRRIRPPALPRNSSGVGLSLHRLLDRPVGELEIDVRIFRQRPQRRRAEANGGPSAASARGEMVER